MTPLFHNSIYDRDDRPEKKGYDTAQICLNGHCVNSSYIDYPEHNQDYCTTYGKPTITACKKCNAPIRGYLRGNMSLSPYKVPSFCYKCGESYRWTQDRLTVAAELA